MFRKQVNGVTTVVTRLSHGAREVDEGIGLLMGKQLCLRLKEFWSLVDCPLSEEAWDKLIADRCKDGRNPFLM